METLGPLLRMEPASCGLNREERVEPLELALVIALSTGGAYASSLIHTNQIANGAVTTKKPPAP